MAKHVLLLQSQVDLNKLAEDIDFFSACYAYDNEQFYVDVPVIFNNGASKLEIEQTLNGIYQTLSCWTSEWLRLYSVEISIDDLSLESIFNFTSAANIDLLSSEHEVVSIKYDKARSSINKVDNVFIVSHGYDWQAFEHQPNDKFADKMFHCSYNRSLNMYGDMIEGNAQSLRDKLAMASNLDKLMPGVFSKLKPIYDASKELYTMTALVSDLDGRYNTEEVSFDFQENYN